MRLLANITPKSPISVLTYIDFISFFQGGRRGLQFRIFNDLRVIGYQRKMVYLAHILLHD